MNDAQLDLETPATSPSSQTAAAVWREFAAVAERTAVRRSALTEMVRLIANQLDLDVCSLYAMEDTTGQLVLVATMGLNQAAIGTVRMRLTQGLVGLVAQELQPVFVPNAPKHRRFRYFPEAGEDPYVSFFGVPIMHRGHLTGVLVAQSAESRDLTVEWAALATAAQRIAPFIESAESLLNQFLA